jgi:type II secretory pathway pseudopilin PulG
MRRRAFTVAELVLALALLAVGVLATAALSISLLRGDRKAIDSSVGTMVARQVLKQHVDQVRANIPVGRKASFWAQDWVNTPWQTGTVRNNDTDFSYAIYAHTVTDTSGTPVGSALPNNRLRKLNVLVHWWASEQARRSGYGKLQASATMLIHEADQ